MYPRTEIEISKNVMSTMEWGFKVIQHTKGQVVLHGYWRDAENEPDNEEDQIIMHVSEIDRLIAALKAVKLMSEVEHD